MKGKRPQVIYWDTSAILSALLKDDNSEQAKKYIDLDVAVSYTHLDVYKRQFIT